MEHESYGRAKSELPERTASVEERLLISAKQLFAVKGYENATTAAIARTAGTSESQLIKYFGSKEGLLESIFEHGWKEMAFIYDAVRITPNLRQRLENILALVLQSFQKDPAMCELMLFEGRRIRRDGNSIVLTKGYFQLANAVDEILTEMQKAGDIVPDINVEAIRSALMGMLEGMLRDMMISRRMTFPASWEMSELPRIFHLVLNGLLTEKGRAAKV